MASDTLETVKCEIRAILLSSKYGISAESIESDYEMLTCKRLPLKELDFKDVQSLMRAIPDVAEEVRSHTGGITYHAVCDESTAHIQKLVSHQVTKKKKSKIEKHGAVGRGGFVGKGEQPPNRSSLKVYPGKLTLKSGADSGDNKCKQQGRVRREYVTVSATYGVRHFKNFQVIVHRCAVEPSSSESDTDISQQTSPVYNLKVRVSQSGDREISMLTQPLWNNRNVDDGGTLASRSDPRDFIHKRQIYVSSLRDAPDSQTNLCDLINKAQACVPSVRYHDKLSKYISRHRKKDTPSLNSVIKKRVVLPPARYCSRAT